MIKLIVSILIGLFFYFKSNNDILVGVIIAAVAYLILRKIFKDKKKRHTPTP